MATRVIKLDEEVEEIMKVMRSWFVHAYTASSTIFGLLTIEAICNQRYVMALWWMAATIFIDATDGTMARKFKVAQIVPNIDGALLDNLVDFLNYVVTPCFFILMSPLVENSWRWIIASAIAMSSAYQFVQKDAKTEDHFFKGFPCYWNIVVLYLFVLESGQLLNGVILLFLCVMVFIPVKYVYPSRMDNVSKCRIRRSMLFVATAAFCVSSLWLLRIYPEKSLVAIGYSLLFVALYVGVSLYRTLNPLEIVRATKMKLRQASRRR